MKQNTALFPLRVSTQSARATGRHGVRPRPAAAEDLPARAEHLDDHHVRDEMSAEEKERRLRARIRDGVPRSLYLPLLLTAPPSYSRARSVADLRKLFEPFGVIRDVVSRMGFAGSANNQERQRENKGCRRRCWVPAQRGRRLSLTFFDPSILPPTQYVPIAHNTGRPRGFAFVEFADEGDAT